MIAFCKLKGLYLLLCVLELDLQGIVISFQGVYLLKGNENKDVTREAASGKSLTVARALYLIGISYSPWLRIRTYFQSGYLAVSIK